jgi:hypothetical protein
MVHRAGSAAIKHGEGRFVMPDRNHRAECPFP